MNLRIKDEDIPAWACRCPVCDGTGTAKLTEKEKQYSWNKGKETRDCRNCGGQYQYGTARGYVRANADGVGCTHHYTDHNVGRCLTESKCIHCGETYTIDSGD
jgi:hypothetical protein